MTQDAIRERDTVTADTADNVVTRAQQGHLTLLDWQPANPLAETARMPRIPRRRTSWPLDWCGTGMVVLMLSALAAGADLLLHLAG